MTNAEKYLKDGVDIEELTDKILEHNKQSKNCTFYENMRSFWKAEIKPTLTEDEKVILRNIKSHCNQIGRDENSILYLGNCNTVYKDRAISGYFNHLFQFIKPRRRI